MTWPSNVSFLSCCWDCIPMKWRRKLLTVLRSTCSMWHLTSKNIWVRAWKWVSGMDVKHPVVSGTDIASWCKETGLKMEDVAVSTCPTVVSEQVCFSVVSSVILWLLWFGCCSCRTTSRLFWRNNTLLIHSLSLTCLCRALGLMLWQKLGMQFWHLGNSIDL